MRWTTLLIVAASPVLLPAGPLAGSASRDWAARPVQLAQEAGGTIVYRPPLRGAPTRRIGGATRGDEAGALALAVLAPEQTGLTAQESPNLYWFLSRAADRPTVFALIRDDWIEPVAEVELGEGLPGGIGRISLAGLGVKLEPGILYEWSIALVTDPQSRSKDIVSSATLELRAPDADLSGRLRAADRLGQVALYAGAGYWYDAIDLISAGITADPQGRAWPAHRSSLLKQVGLDQAAVFDQAR